VSCSVINLGANDTLLLRALGTCHSDCCASIAVAFRGAIGPSEETKCSTPGRFLAEDTASSDALKAAFVKVTATDATSINASAKATHLCKTRWALGVVVVSVIWPNYVLAQDLLLARHEQRLAILMTGL